jgi:hypothetical protein
MFHPYLLQRPLTVFMLPLVDDVCPLVLATEPPAILLIAVLVEVDVL